MLDSRSFQEIFPDFVVAPLGEPVYIGNEDLNNYSGGMKVHIDSDNKARTPFGLDVALQMNCPRDGPWLSLHGKILCP